MSTTLGTTQISAAPPELAAPAPPSKRARLVSVVRTIASNDAVKIAAIVSIFGWFLLKPIIWHFVGENDVWWHIRTGEWIMQHHKLPRSDPFSSTGAGKPWVAYSWPFEIAVYEIVKQWDLLGIVAVSIFLWTGMTLALFYLIRRFQPPFWISVALAFAGSIVMTRVTSSRPGPLTVIFFCLVLGLLIDAQRHKSVRKLWPIPILIWMWANVHVQFVYGLFVVGIFCMIPVFDWLLSKFGVQPDADTRYLPAKWIWGTLALSTALTFANPYGVGVYRVLWEFIQQPKLYKFINETKAMQFDLKVHFVVLVVCLLGALALGRLRRIQPVWAILFLWAALSGFHAERDMWLAATISFCIIADYFAKRHPHAAPVDRRVWLGAVACVLLCFVVRFKTAPTNHDLGGLVGSRMPLGAVAYIHEHHLQGPIFNDFDWGGFLIYALPEMPVVIDGRTNVHGQDEIARSLQTWNVLGTNWYDDPLLQQANLVIGDPQYALTYVLRTDPHFKAVFEDGTVVLYQRVLPPTPMPKEPSSK
ncbi:MAG: hypothetical protein ACXVZV_04655 [Terriglobales bacterium]